MNIIRKPRGTQDIHSERMKIMKKIVEVAKDILEKNNCKELIFPTFESSDLFRISLGSMTDIVHKEMFVFKDKKGREMTLRPEGTVCVARLVCENNLLNRNESKKFFYLSNMFRYERPQKGRYREF
jgi:histidyl-tRNA synthetase